MKEVYDRKSVSREFKVGDKVLLLDPVRKSLECRYDVVISKSNNVYEISTPGKRRAKQLVHINRLKPFVTEESSIQTSALTVGNPIIMQESTSQLEKESRLSNSDSINHLSSKLTHLSSSQALDVERLLESFRDLCGDVPTQTSLIEYDILLKDGATPCKQAPYRVSPYEREILKRETQFLLDNNLAESSSSPWSSPCMLVGKPDGTHRLCTDFRLVNSNTISNAYRLPG